jgi:phosphate transport system substrate-binding protein
MNKACLFAVALALTGCAGKKQGDAVPETATSGTFELVADETLRPAIDSLVYGFNIQTPNAKVTVRYQNATEALDDLLQHRTRLILISRPLGKKEQAILNQEKIELTEADVAENAIACIVSRQSMLRSMSMDSLRRIVGDNLNGVIRVSSSHLSGTEYALDSIFSRDSYQSGRIRRFQTTDSIVSFVRGNDRAIGFIGAAWMKEILKVGDSTIHSLLISGVTDHPVMLHPAYILKGLYPLVSRICAYTTEVPNTLPRGFLAYAMSADGQRVFLNYDLLPKTQILKLVPAQ